MADGITIARGLLGAAQVGDGPTPEQTALVQSLMHGYFGLDADAASLSPLSASEFAAAVETTDTKRVVDLLVVLDSAGTPTARPRRSGPRTTPARSVRTSRSSSSPATR